MMRKILAIFIALIPFLGMAQVDDEEDLLRL